jgi:hypothetical protein
LQGWGDQQSPQPFYWPAAFKAAALPVFSKSQLCGFGFPVPISVKGDGNLIAGMVLL